jgi:hypothetical protein
VRVIDPGHEYALQHLDGNGEERLVFVKREGHGYPGNIGAHEGTTMQEVLRALIDRAKYVNKQIPDEHTEAGIDYRRRAILHFEIRAAIRHGRESLFAAPATIEDAPTCETCGHVACISHTPANREEGTK